MAHFAFVTPPYAGHLNPMLALAGQLTARGHRATFVAQADAGPLVRRPGIEFAEAGADTHPPGTLASMTARLASTTGLFGIGGVIRDVARTTFMLCRDGPRVMRAIGADAIVADQTEAAGGLLARHLGLPQISVANALLINREASVPPPFIGWGYDDSARGVKRNLGGYRVADLMMRPLFGVIRRQAEAWRLGPISSLEDCLSPLLQISQSVEGFDFPRRHAPSSLVHVGPLREPNVEDRPEPDGRPLVFCSLGTLQGARFPIFRTAAQACDDLDLSLVVAHGGRLSPRQIAGLPGRPRVEAYVPQRALMERAAAVITHGGLNTVLDALAAGVPLIVVPLAFEQGAIAARVVRCGAGMAIAPRRLTPVRVAAALTALRLDPAFRGRAAVLRNEIARAGGVRRACDLIEAVAGHFHTGHG